jgi:ATP-dependent RNA helicase DHX34
MHTLRMPAAQTLLLFAHTIDTNVTMSRLVCDTWLLMEFPVPEAGQALLLKASNLRRTWNKLLEMKLQNSGSDVEDVKAKAKNTEELEYELWQNLANYMNTEVCYTVKRLLPADMKTIYVGPFENVDLILDPNPFADDFQCLANSSKGGVYITENIIYGW